MSELINKELDNLFEFNPDAKIRDELDDETGKQVLTEVQNEDPHSSIFTAPEIILKHQGEAGTEINSPDHKSGEVHTFTAAGTNETGHGALSAGNGITKKTNTESSGSAASGRTIPKAPKLGNIPRFPKDKYVDKTGKKLKKYYGKYTFTCPNCGTTLTDEDCVIDFYRAIHKYMTGEYSATDDSSAREELTKSFFSGDRNTFVFFEADWKKIQTLEKDINGYTILRCRDLLLCMLEKVIKDIQRDKLDDIVSGIVNADAMRSAEQTHFLEGLRLCLGKCGVVVSKRREDAIDLEKLTSHRSNETNKININDIRNYINLLYVNREAVVLRAKISRHEEELFDKSGVYLAGFDFELGIHETTQILERRCPQAECGRCVSHLSGGAEEHVIGMLGGPGSGKTAYMTALLNFLTEGVHEDGETITLSRCGVTTGYNDSDCDGGMGDFIKTYLDKYKKGRLVRKTEVGDGQHYSFRVNGKACPYLGRNPVDNSVFSIDKYENMHRIITVVDIAGEQLSDKENLQAVVSRTDMFWFCISPGQLEPSVKDKEEEGYRRGKVSCSNITSNEQTNQFEISAAKTDKADRDAGEATDERDSGYKISNISTIIRNVHSVYEINVPVALIITKSDMFSDKDNLPPQIHPGEQNGSKSIGLADMVNLSPDKAGESLSGGRGFTGYKVRALDRYQQAIQEFFQADDRKGTTILNDLYGNSDRKCAFFACAAYGTSDSRNLQPYGVFQPLLWTLAVLGVLPVVCPADPVETKKKVGLFKKETVFIYDENYQSKVYTPSVICPDKEFSEKFDKLLFW